MDMATADSQVREIIAEVLQVEDVELTPGALLAADLNMDSLDRVELAMVLEEKLLNGESIDEDEAEKWQTVQDVLNTMQSMTGDRPC
jgi:acyl carrier protein